MAQVESSQNRDEQSILRDVLQIVADCATPADGIDALIRLTMKLTSATGALYVIFQEPQIFRTYEIDAELLPDFFEFEQLAESLETGIHTNPPLPDGFNFSSSRFVMAQIVQRQRLLGSICLFGNENMHLNEEEINAILEGITVLTTQLRMQARHEKLSRNQNEFMRIVSHDLRSPLTAMQGFASMLESGMVGEINEKQTYFIEKILSGITQMTGLVENIQDAGRFDPETGFYEMERSPCDLVEIVSRIVVHHLVPAEKQELTISGSVDDVPIINADRNMIERAITNLVDNAIKYTPNGGDIEVGLKNEDENITIYVRDSGLGISPENQKKLFQRHVRIPRTEHKRVKGSGLGLFIVKSVAQQHGGRAWIKSVEGEGSTFGITIPLKANLLISDD